MTRKLPSIATATVPSPSSSTSTPRAATKALTRSLRTSTSTSKKTFVVTGANRGIGLGLARALSKLGHVIGTSRDPSTADDLNSLPNVTVLALDVTSASSIASFVTELTELAPNGVDLLWNNAGVSFAKFVVTDDDIDSEAWVNELRVNTVGHTMVTRAVLPLLRKGYSEGGIALRSGKGEDRKIVFTSSICGSVASTTGAGSGCAYFSSKAALNSSVKFWHNQMAKEGFVVTPIHPGWVRTDMGGPDAELTVEQSVAGMLDTVSKLDADTELKLRVWDGSVLPW